MEPGCVLRGILGVFLEGEGETREASQNIDITVECGRVSLINILLQEKRKRVSGYNKKNNN